MVSISKSTAGFLMCWKGTLLLFVMHLFTQESSVLIQHLVLIEAQLFLNWAFQMGWLKHKEVKRLVWGHTASQWLCLDLSPELFKATTPWLLKRQFYPLCSDLISMKKKYDKSSPLKAAACLKRVILFGKSCRVPVPHWSPSNWRGVILIYSVIHPTPG